MNLTNIYTAPENKKLLTFCSNTCKFVLNDPSEDRVLAITSKPKQTVGLTIYLMCYQKLVPVNSLGY